MRISLCLVLLVAVAVSNAMENHNRRKCASPTKTHVEMSSDLFGEKQYNRLEGVAQIISFKPIAGNQLCNEGDYGVDVDLPDQVWVQNGCSGKFDVDIYEGVCDYSMILSPQMPNRTIATACEITGMICKANYAGTCEFDVTYDHDDNSVKIKDGSDCECKFIVCYIPFSDDSDEATTTKRPKINMQSESLKEMNRQRSRQNDNADGQMHGNLTP